MVAVMSIFCKKKCNLQSANSGNEKLSCQKPKRANFPEENSRKSRNLSQKTKKGQLLKKLVPKLKKYKQNSTNLKKKNKKTHPDCKKMPDPSISPGLKVKNETIRVLLDSGSSKDLLFMKKGSSKCIFIAKRFVPQSWGTSNGTFITDKVVDIEISFVEYSGSKKVCLQMDIVEYSLGDQEPMYDLIIGIQTLMT